MLPQSSSPNPSTMCQDLERHILDRTGRRVFGLSVHVVGDRVILTGRAVTYYAKQLAQHCVWDILPTARLENSIIVDR